MYTLQVKLFDKNGDYIKTDSLSIKDSTKKEGVKTFVKNIYKDFNDVTLVVMYKDAPFIMINKSVTKNAENIDFYIDGSYAKLKKQPEYGSGIVVVKNNNIIDQISKKHKIIGKIEHGSIESELQSAISALNYALKHNYKDITLNYDADIICRCVTDNCKSNSPKVKQYKNEYDRISKLVNIRFKHQTSNKFSKLAHKLARQAIGLKP